MSFIFRGTRADIENSSPAIAPEQHVRIHAARPIDTNSFAFLITVVLLLVVLNCQQVSPNLLLWLVFGFFFMATILRMYATCQQLEAQARADAIAASDLLWLQMPPSTAFAYLRHLQLQLAHLDQQLDDLAYSYSLSEEQIHVLPLHKYKVPRPQSNIRAFQPASPSSPLQRQLDIAINIDTCMGSSENELTCSICLEQVNDGELIRSLPCLHQYHADCIDSWLSRKGTCPVCKFKVEAGWHQDSYTI
ncbi:E3 ubiquitin-protein ligase SDIR1-like [Silene latifolia]|uniref:E3 ubiquitin-protein ligase SDIR1-like n=1 Tax=Silene latifolia TaxID=37657 RepID=UPI003D787C5A